MPPIIKQHRINRKYIKQLINGASFGAFVGAFVGASFGASFGAFITYY